MSWTSLCDFDELSEGRGKYVEIGGFQLAVFLNEGKVYVTDNTCPHAGHSLSGGEIVGGCVVCPWHAWAFRLENGQLRDAPLVTIRTYRTRFVEPAGRAKLVQADLPIY
ncbi:MAG TPA: Rieske (2Fe-2S) protein [Tepidisphaeraceae bacterium]|jgi:nitrite reductase/ring-hydroxylating ferredoxin subunit|nr:Rieske (2Fe-2S) protein [Tepidisphaeraceae bacterium]